MTENRTGSGSVFSGNFVEGIVIGSPVIGGVELNVATSLSNRQNPTADVTYSATISGLGFGIEVGYSTAGGWFGYAGFSEIAGFVSGSSVFAGIGYSQIGGWGVS